MTRQELIEKIARAIAEMEGFYLTAAQPTLAQRNANPGNIRQWRDGRGSAYPTHRGYVDFVACFRTLHANAYCGPFLVEMWTEKAADPIAEIRHARRWVGERMAQGGYT